MFYVAMTRAEEHCFLSYAKSRFKYGKMEFSSPSRFLKDIDAHYLNLPQDELMARRIDEEAAVSAVRRAKPPASIGCPLGKETRFFFRQAESGNHSSQCPPHSDESGCSHHPSGRFGYIAGRCAAGTGHRARTLRLGRCSQGGRGRRELQGDGALPQCRREAVAAEICPFQSDRLTMKKQLRI